MTALFAWLLNGLRALFANRLGLWIASAFAWLGVVWGSQKIVLTPLLNSIANYAQGIGGAGEYAAYALQWAGVLKIDIMLTMFISAYSLKAGVSATSLFLKRRPA